MRSWNYRSSLGMENTVLVIGCFLLTVTSIYAQQTGSELPSIGALGVLGISMSASTSILSSAIQDLRADLEACEDKLEDLEECQASLKKARDEEEECRRGHSECEEAYFKAQEDLSKAKEDKEKCDNDFGGNFKEFLNKFCNAYVNECICAENTTPEECAAETETSCNFDVAQGFCKPGI
ncbi:uncharacterized protein LOC133188959 [Saccostrea echinata]|uniref:uncharacterized protein LOC133188959 n=1 Tax=Saccostrea echinata TaxID=191078 RepID=UPI002A7FECF8|nr:uncharacterized protein LOC133188959 [Saccostrea echinata]